LLEKLLLFSIFLPWETFKLSVSPLLNWLAITRFPKLRGTSLARLKNRKDHIMKLLKAKKKDSNPKEIDPHSGASISVIGGTPSKERA